MKNKFIFLFLILNISLMSQDFIPPIDSLTGKITYSSVVEIPFSISAESLNDHVKDFFISRFSTLKKVNQSQINNSFSAEYEIPVYVRNLNKEWLSGYVIFNIKIDCKDNKYRYVFTDFYHVDHMGNSNKDLGPLESIIGKNDRKMGVSQGKYYQGYLKQVDEFVLSLKNDLYSSIINVNSKSDW